MNRGWSELVAIPELLPAWAALLLGLVTQLGDPWFVTLLLVVTFLLRPADRRQTAVVAGLVVAGMALTIGLKHTFAVPRPVRPPIDPALLPEYVRTLYDLTATADGYGFPSGHAVLSTTTYGGFAALLSIDNRRRGLTAAGALVALVGFTRVALGVHYLGDVVAGVALGGVLVLGGWLLVARQVDQRATIALGAGVVCSAFALIASDATLDAILLFGTAVAALAAWWQVAPDAVRQ